MSVKKFFENDFHSTLYPLKTNLILIREHHLALEKHIEDIFSKAPQHADKSFLAQTRVFAAKPKHHLRRTAILDPVASYFIYDLTYRNRAVFRPTSIKNRKSFGYCFAKGIPVSVHAAYQDYSAEANASELFYEHWLSFDVSSYFNSIYHHDATSWFSQLSGIDEKDADAFGRFFREINSGRSIDFLPQGIYPTKMIGSAFLQFVEQSGQLRSAEVLRFMDDFILFDDNKDVLLHDFMVIQRLLGLRGLNVNPTKTRFNRSATEVHDAMSEIELQLSEILDEDYNDRSFMASGAELYDWDNDDEEVKTNSDASRPSLDESQIKRLLKLLSNPAADESDVEAILNLLHSNTDGLIAHIPTLLARFPNIVKQLHIVAGAISDKNALTKEILKFISGNTQLIEYQLFWLAVIAEEHLSETRDFGKLLFKLYDRSADHKIARSKILEIPEQRFGLKEIREEILKSGSSEWLGWASAMGARSMSNRERNHLLGYFAKSSPLNSLIAECVRGL